jgi:hypothetical protein
MNFGEAQNYIPMTQIEMIKIIEDHNKQWNEYLATEGAEGQS